MIAGDQTKSMLFKEVPGGFVFRAPHPWVFGRADHYLVNDAKQAEILAITPRRPILAAAVIIIVISLAVAAGVGTALFFDRVADNLIISGLAMVAVILLVFYVPLLVASRVRLRKLRPILAGVPLTDQRITNADIRRTVNAAMSFKQLLLVCVANAFAFLASGVAFVLIRNHQHSLLSDPQSLLFLFNTIVFGLLAAASFRRVFKKLQQDEALPVATSPILTKRSRTVVMASAISVLGLAGAIAYVGIEREFSDQNQGLRYQAKGEIDNAIASFSKAIEGDKSNVAAYQARAKSYVAKGDHDRAIADYTRIIEIEPANAIAYRNRGASHRAQGGHDKAIADYTKAIELDPSYSYAYYFRSVSYAAKGDNDRAIADLTKSIELSPKDAYAYVSRGLRLEAKGDHDRAVADYTKAIEVNARYANAYFFRGRRLEAKGDHERAIADFTKAIEFDPKDTVAYNSRAAIYSLTGERDRAIADYRSIIELPAASPAERRRQDAAREQIAKLTKSEAPPPAAPDGTATARPK